MADSADLALETPVDYDIEIDRLCNLSEEDLKRVKGSSKPSGISLSRVKQISEHMSLNRCFNKSILIDNIIKKRKRVAELAALHSSEALEEESDDDEIASKFISNVNTFPRICNIMTSLMPSFDRLFWRANTLFKTRKRTKSSQYLRKLGTISTISHTTAAELFRIIQNWLGPKLTQRRTTPQGLLQQSMFSRLSMPSFVNIQLYQLNRQHLDSTISMTFFLTVLATWTRCICTWSWKA